MYALQASSSATSKPPADGYTSRIIECTRTDTRENAKYRGETEITAQFTAETVHRCFRPFILKGEIARSIYGLV